MRRRDIWMLVLDGLLLCAASEVLGSRTLAIPGFLLVGLGGALFLLHGQWKGLLWTPLGLVRRSECRSCFRRHLGMSWALLSVWTLGGILYGLGLIGP